MDDRNSPDGSPFRKEAQDYHADGRAGHGDVLRLSPVWLGRTYPVIILFFVALLMFLVLGRMSDYAEGPAIVHVEGGANVTSPVTAKVLEVLIETGQPVEAGQLLVRLDDTEQKINVELLEEELATQTASFLRDRGNESSRRAVASLRSQLALARQQLAARHLVAPRNGVVSGIHTRPGQLLTTGQLAMVVAGANSHFSLVAALPGHFQPQLDSRQSARFQVTGYPYSYSEVAVTRVFDEVVGPADAVRFLGPEAAGGLQLQGALVLVEATIGSGSFEADRSTFELADGMHGTLQVRLRSLPIILNLLPGLRYIWEGNDHGFGE